jgi:hypothetical protein
MRLISFSMTSLRIEGFKRADSGLHSTKNFGAEAAGLEKALVGKALVGKALVGKAPVGKAPVGKAAGHQENPQSVPKHQDSDLSEGIESQLGGRLPATIVVRQVYQGTLKGLYREIPSTKGGGSLDQPTNVADRRPHRQLVPKLHAWLSTFPLPALFSTCSLILDKIQLI